MANKTFAYKAIDEMGEVFTGEIEVSSKDDVLQYVSSQGQKLISVAEVKTSASQAGSGNRKIKLDSIILFSRLLSTMLDAGMTVDKAIHVLTEQIVDKNLRASLDKIYIDVQKGLTLSASLRKCGKAFPDLLVKMVASGEATGNLGEALDRMAVHYEKEKTINGKIKGAMMYPIVLVFITIIATAVLLIVAIPEVAKMFEDNGAELPGLTLFVMDVSDFLIATWYILIPLVVGVVFAYRYAMSLYGSFRLMVDKLKLNAVLVKEQIRKIVVARFSRTLATLVASGIPIVESIYAAAGTTGNKEAEILMSDMAKNIEKGHGITSEMEKIYIFQPISIAMVSVGETSGSLEEMLFKLADFYDEELDSAIQKLLTLLEPLLIIFMGVIIGTVVLAMYLPMFEMFSVMV